MKIEVGQVWVDLDYLGMVYVVTEHGGGYVTAEVYEEGKKSDGVIRTTDNLFRFGKVPVDHLEDAIHYYKKQMEEGNILGPVLVSRGVPAHQIIKRAKLENISL